MTPTVTFPPWAMVRGVGTVMLNCSLMGVIPPALLTLVVRQPEVANKARNIREAI